MVYALAFNCTITWPSGGSLKPATKLQSTHINDMVWGGWVGGGGGGGVINNKAVLAEHKTVIN